MALLGPTQYGYGVAANAFGRNFMDAYNSSLDRKQREQEQAFMQQYRQGLLGMQQQELEWRKQEAALKAAQLERERLASEIPVGATQYMMGQPVTLPSRAQTYGQGYAPTRAPQTVKPTFQMFARAAQQQNPALSFDALTKAWAQFNMSPATQQEIDARLQADQSRYASQFGYDTRMEGIKHQNDIEMEGAKQTGKLTVKDVAADYDAQAKKLQGLIAGENLMSVGQSRDEAIAEARGRMKQMAAWLIENGVDPRTIGLSSSPLPSSAPGWTQPGRENIAPEQDTPVNPYDPSGIL